MNIQFSTITCEPEYVNKLAYMSYLLPFNSPVECTARYPFDILNPVITIQTPIGFGMYHYNYFYISDLQRYYYITGITAINDNLWEISGHIDVLYTYRTQILENSAIIARQEFQYNLDLVDSELITSAGREYTVMKFPNSDSIIPATSTSKSFVLTVAGGHSST